MGLGAFPLPLHTHSNVMTCQPLALHTIQDVKISTLLIETPLPTFLILNVIFADLHNFVNFLAWLR